MGNANWETPNGFFLTCNDAWGPFDVDAAADKNNTKCREYLSARVKSESSEWPFFKKRVWLNPPYTNIGGWVNSAREEARLHDNLTALLLPMPRGDAWFTMLREVAEIIEIDGRLKFLDPIGRDRISPAGGNILAIFRPPTTGLIWPVGYTGGRIELLNILPVANPDNLPMFEGNPIELGRFPEAVYNPEKKEG